MMEDTQFCSHCGAANRIEQDLCFACHQPLDADANEADQSSVLLGRYRLLAQIGSGGFGAVYKALDIEANEALIAIKQINLKKLSPQEIIEATSAFNREVELLSSLSHPQLPRIYDQFSDPEHWYVVMDYIEGQTLEEYLQEREGRRQPLTVLEALDIGLQLCHVLRYLHTRQPPVIFRDLKPENVMRTPRGELYLIDFGIARHFKPGQKRDTIPLGSPGYAAPEQYGRAQTTPQADIYSLGALLHRMLSQIEPSERPLTFVPLNLPGVEVNTALNALLRRMQALVSSERPQSIRDVEYELRHIKQVQIEAEGTRIWSPTQSVPAPPLKPGQKPLYIPSGSGGQQQFQMQSQQQRAAFSRRQALIAGATVVTGLTLFGGMLSPMFRTSRFRGEHRHPDLDQATPIPQPPGAVFWSNRLQLVAYTYPGTRIVKIYDPHAQNVISSFSVEGSVSSLDLYWSADDTRLLTVTDQYYLETWTVPGGERVAHFIPPGKIDASIAVWSADGTHIATSEQNNLFVWPTTGEAGDSKPLAVSQSLISSIAWSPDNKYLAFLDAIDVTTGVQTIAIWDVVHNQHMRNITGPISMRYPGSSAYPGSKMLWSPSGSWIAFAEDGLWMLDPVKGIAYLLSGFLDSTFLGMAWSPDGTRLAIGREKTIEIWNAPDQLQPQKIPELKNQPIAIGWSPDGQNILTGDANGNVSSWPVDQ
ncbi:MAG TPA: WD40 repeat domain-containing serine/threonine protein kinase [Ktedonobacteraceae bacterium]|nr:WD40 repeat domain-containing serine/threonine protein kinase [Ktedonobacteraceae bacterium]